MANTAAVSCSMGSACGLEKIAGWGIKLRGPTRRTTGFGGSFRQGNTQLVSQRFAYYKWHQRLQCTDELLVVRVEESHIVL